MDRLALIGKLRLILLACLFLLFGCSRQESAKRYQLTGTVLAINSSANTLNIKHEDIQGLMKGMTMNFRVKDPAVLMQLHAQDRITADLVIAGDRSWLENIRITQRGQASASDSSAIQSSFHTPQLAKPYPVSDSLINKANGLLLPVSADNRS